MGNMASTDKTYQEREQEEAFLTLLFIAVWEDVKHEWRLNVRKVGPEGTLAHEHVSNREALDTIKDDIENIVTAPDGKIRRMWIKLAVHAMSRVVALDLKAGHISPALPGVDK